jgi:hypothetical protein
MRRIERKFWRGFILMFKSGSEEIWELGFRISDFDFLTWGLVSRLGCLAGIDSREVLLVQVIILGGWYEQG